MSETQPMTDEEATMEYVRGVAPSMPATAELLGARIRSVFSALELARLDGAVDHAALVAVQEAYRLSQAQLAEAHSECEANERRDANEIERLTVQLAEMTGYRDECERQYQERVTHSTIEALAALLQEKYDAANAQDELDCIGTDGCPVFSALRDLPAASHEWLQAHDAALLDSFLRRPETAAVIEAAIAPRLQAQRDEAARRRAEWGKKQGELTRVCAGCGSEDYHVRCVTTKSPSRVTRAEWVSWGNAALCCLEESAK